jgi:hypothetical protein
VELFICILDNWSSFAAALKQKIRLIGGAEKDWKHPVISAMRIIPGVAVDLRLHLIQEAGRDDLELFTWLSHWDAEAEWQAALAARAAKIAKEETKAAKPAKAKGRPLLKFLKVGLKLSP